MLARPSRRGAPTKENRLLETLVTAFADEFEIDMLSVGSMTLKLKPHGAEPDSSFYVENFPAVRHKDTVDLAVDPPPDIVVELDVSPARIDEAQLYAALKVPEFWRYDNNVLRAYEFAGDAYREIEESKNLRGLRIADLNRFLNMQNSLTPRDVRKRWRAWLQEQHDR